MVSNGLASQQSSVHTIFNGELAPNAQAASVMDGVAYGPNFPDGIANNASLFQASPNILIGSPSFRTPYVLQSSFQVETQIARDTTLSFGTMWTHGVHLIAGSAYDLNLLPPTGTTTYVICPPNANVVPCSGRQIVLPNLDAGLQQEGLISQNVQQINALISPEINNYNSLFVQAQRRLRTGLQFSLAYTFAKNLTRNGVDFNNQFDLRDTEAPYRPAAPPYNRRCLHPDRRLGNFTCLGAHCGFRLGAQHSHAVQLRSPICRAAGWHIHHSSRPEWFAVRRFCGPDGNNPVNDTAVN